VKMLSLDRLKNMKLVDIISPRIVRFKWVAKDDPKTCVYCASRSGMVVEATDPEYTIYMPPAHPHCRCLWQSLTSDEEFIPERSWIKPTESMITRYAPFLLLVPFLKGKKEEIIDIIPFLPEVPEPKFNPEEILVINNIENTKEKVKDSLVNNIIEVVFIGKKGETVLDKEFEIDSSFDLTIREEKLVKEKAVAYIMDTNFEAFSIWEDEIKKKYYLKNKF